MQKYPTDLIESQLVKIKKFFTKHKRKHRLRKIVSALLYVVKSGIQWRMLPLDFPNWKLVYYYFHRWTGKGLIEEIYDSLRVRKESPSLGLMDSQSVKSSCILKIKGMTQRKSFRQKTSYYYLVIV